jgi:hypothetical protein
MLSNTGLSELVGGKPTWASPWETARYFESSWIQVRQRLFGQWNFFVITPQEWFSDLFTLDRR